MERVKFSVLLSTYEKENPKYLQECFKSIYDDQEVKPDEIVLIEDGPLTDDLYKVIENLKIKLKDTLKIISLEKNVRLGNALRIGVENCSNEIIARMDTDDIAYPDRFKKQINYILEHQDVDILGSYMSEFTEDINNIIAIKTAPLKNFEKYIKVRCPMNHPSVIFKKSKVLEVGNYIEVLYNEDMYLWGRMLASNCKFANMEDPLIYFRVTDDTYKRRGGLQYARAEIYIQKKFLKLGLVNEIEFLRNIILRNTVRVLPNKIRKIIYLLILRKKV